MARPLVTLLAAAVAVLALAAPAAAVPARPPAGMPAYAEHRESAHFQVHYTTAPGEADATTEEHMAALLANAETAYARYVGEWGYPPPLDDGDGRTDVYVVLIPGLGAAAGPDSGTGSTTTGFLVIPPRNATGLYAVAHELFHVIQMGIYQHESGWLSESTAEWAGQNVVAAGGAEAPPNWFHAPWVSLDCMGTCPDGDGSGYRGSIFMEHLDERFGMGLVHAVFDRAAQLGAGNDQPHGLQALGDAIAARGSSLSQAFTDYAIAATAGTIARAGVTSRRPATSHSLTTGTLAGRLQPIGFVVDHLAFNSMVLSGNAPATSPPVCKARRLTFEVALPPGVPTQVAFVQGAAVTPLAVAGGVASATVPWSDCAASEGTLVVPNGSLTADDQRFSLTMTLADVPTTPAPTPVTPRRKGLTLRARAGRKGTVRLTVHLPKTGRLTLRATTRYRRRTTTYAGRTLTIRSTGTRTIVLKPGRKARATLRRAGKLKLTIRATLKPRSGKTEVSKTTLTVRVTA